MEGKISNQHYLHSYLSYIKLSKTIERNLLLIDNLKNYLPGGKVEEGRKITKPQDLVRLYDIIIQVCYEIYFLASGGFCRLLITFANSLNPDQGGHSLIWIQTV